MKAVFIKDHGGLDKLTYGERPVPKIGPREVLVRVRACALNHLDIWVRQGLPGLTLSFPHILGCDVAGVVAKAGAEVKNVPVGKRVMAAPGVACGRCESCLMGQDQLCPKYDILGQARDGGYAEYVAVPADNLIDIPEHLDFVEAAAIPLVFMTAWQGLVNLAKMKAGENVLILGGGSGLGSAAIQIAKLWGARVFTTVGADAKAKKAKALGADVVINHTTKDFAAEIKNLTEKRGVDVVLDHVGPATLEKSLQSLAKSGRLAACGATTGRHATIELRPLFSRNITVYGFRMGPRHGLMEAMRFFNTRQLKPIVDKTFPLRKAADAQAYMEERKNFGKIVLTV